MSYSSFDPAGRNLPAWNAGRKNGPKRALNQKEVWAVSFWLEREDRLRDRAIFDLAVDSILRGCDLVRLKFGDLVSGNDIRTRALVFQCKTGRPVQFEILERARSILLKRLERSGGTVEDHAFPSRVNHSQHLSTRQYGRLVDGWVTAIGLNASDFGTNSLRRTKAAMLYEQTGNLRAVHILFGNA